MLDGSPPTFWGNNSKTNGHLGSVYIHTSYLCMYIYIYINAHNTYTRYRNYSPLKIFCQSNNHKFWWENSWSVSLREKKQWFAVNFFYRIRYGKAPKNNAFTLCPGPLSETGGIRVYDIPYIYSISQLSYTIHIYTIHRPYIYHTYTIHIPYIYHTYIVYLLSTIQNLYGTWPSDPGWTCPMRKPSKSSEWRLSWRLCPETIRSGSCSSS